MTDLQTRPPQDVKPGPRGLGEWGRGFWIRLIALGLIDAVAIYAALVLLEDEAWGLLTSLIVGTLFINWVYLWPRTNALRWLTPGLVLMAAFVVFPIFYAVYVSLTNWSTGNIIQKDQVIAQLEQRTFTDPSAQGELFDLHIYVDDATGDVRLYLIDEEGDVLFGEPRDRLDAANPDALEDPEALGVGPVADAGVPGTIGPFRLLAGPELFAFANANDPDSLVLDIPDGSVTILKIPSPLAVGQGRVVQAAVRYEYDGQRDVLRDLVFEQDCVPGTVTDVGGDEIDNRGNFVCADGTVLEPGWIEIIGADNYVRVATNDRIRSPFIRVFTWNIIFAFLSVVLTFFLGLGLALAMQHDRVRGKFAYRSILILPYAVPGFLTILVWRGLLNQDFGQINTDLLQPITDLLNVDPIPWLSDGTWAKVAILLVNTWLGFPYMYLITTGALQSIPAELQEAARVDGASGRQVFWRVTFPLLMVSLAPLLIGSFAFNFNNFILIFLLTNGGPPILDAAVPVGETDILISFTFDVAVQSGRGANFGLGAVITIFIFALVAIISAFSFRFTKRLEEVYGAV